jgi:hypothetical protein
MAYLREGERPQPEPAERCEEPKGDANTRVLGDGKILLKLDDGKVV